MRKIIYKLKSIIIKWFGNILIYPYPMFMMLGHTSYKIKGENIRDILNIIQPGDIILRRYNNYISGLMIPGYFTHAAIYIGNNKIIHMLGKGIDKQDILTFTRCDDIAIIHCNNKQISKIAIQKAEDLFGCNVKYDFDFDFSDSTRYSCTELIDYLYNKPKIKRKKANYIIPDDYLTLDKTLFELKYKRSE